MSKKCRCHEKSKREHRPCEKKCRPCVDFNRPAVAPVKRAIVKQFITAQVSGSEFTTGIPFNSLASRGNLQGAAVSNIGGYGTQDVGPFF